MRHFGNINPAKSSNETRSCPRRINATHLVTCWRSSCVATKSCNQNTQMYLHREESQEIVQVDVDWWS
jgi:hypothetical protein